MMNDDDKPAKTPERCPTCGSDECFGKFVADIPLEEGPAPEYVGVPITREMLEDAWEQAWREGFSGRGGARGILWPTRWL